MSQHDIHDIIEQISHSLDCPQCKTRILPHNIAITDIKGADCTFDVLCQRCKTEMTLSAHVERTTAEAARTHNRSSQLAHDSSVGDPINEQDVLEMQWELSNFCGSFIEAFAK